MKKMFLLAAAAAAVVATPAMAAGDGYAKVRVSYDSTEIEVEDAGTSASESTGKGIGYGFALGYDFDLGSSAFFGAEVGLDDSSADRDVDGVRISSGREISAVGRVGFKKDMAKLYGLAGYSDLRVKVSDGVDSEAASEGGFTWGAGVAYDVRDNISVGLEYRNISIDGGQDLEDLVGVDDVNFNKSRILLGLSYRF